MSLQRAWKQAERDLPDEFMVKRFGDAVAAKLGFRYAATHEEGGYYHLGATPHEALGRAMTCGLGDGPCTEKP